MTVQNECKIYLADNLITQDGRRSNLKYFQGRKSILKIDIIHGEFYLSENQFSVGNYLTLIGVKVP